MIIAPYAALLAILYIVLILRVVSARKRVQAAFGDHNDAALLARVRGHGNLAEHAPILLILLYLCAKTGYPDWVIHALGVAIVAGRLLHAYSCSFLEGQGAHLRYRLWGMMLTLGPLGVMATLLLAATILQGYFSLTALES